MINLLRWSIRLAGLGALVLGVLIWQGIVASLNLHMALGLIVALVLGLTAAVYAIVDRVRIPLAIIALFWATVTVYIGVTQGQLMPGSNHGVIEIIHVILGIGAIGIAEALAGAIARRKSSPV